MRRDPQLRRIWKQFENRRDQRSLKIRRHVQFRLVDAEHGLPGLVALHEHVEEDIERRLLPAGEVLVVEVRHAAFGESERPRLDAAEVL